MKDGLVARKALVLPKAAYVREHPNYVLVLHAF